MTLHPRATLLACLVLAASCGGAPATRIELVIAADAEVRARADAVRLRVVGGTARDATEMVETRRVAEIGWPAQATIVPRDGDATRPVRVEVEALLPSGQTLAVAGASTGFVEGETRRVEIRLGVCAGAPCDPEPPADAGAPHDAARPRSEPPPDAGAPPVAPIDACAPSEERCEGAADEDCDGAVDERCDCTDGAERPCPDGTDEGECARGTQRCAGGRWGECAGEIERRDEGCDGRDEDCDGRIDEDLTRSCGGRHCEQACSGGAWGRCRDRDGDPCDGDRDD